MFQPNSIRGLLSKRKTTKINEEGSTVSQVDKMSKTFTNFNVKKDEDQQACFQTRLMIRQIDHEIDKSRTWRQHQKQLLEEKLKSNKALQKVSRDEYLKYKDLRNQEEILQNQKLIQKMKISENRLKKINNNSFVQIGNSETLESSEGGELDLCEDWESDYVAPELIDSIMKADNKVSQKRRFIGEDSSNYQDQHLAFLSSIDSLASGAYFLRRKDTTGLDEPESKKQQTENKQEPSFNRDKLKEELNDIDKELREMQELLKD